MCGITGYILVKTKIKYLIGKTLIVSHEKKGCIHNKTHGKKIPGQKTPRIKNTKAKLDIKHYCKIGHKTLSKKHYCKKNKI